MTIQKWVGLSVSLLSLYTIVANIFHFQQDAPRDSILALSFGVFSLIVFTLSTFMKQSFFKPVQVILIATVSIVTICINDQTKDLFQVILGVFFLFVAFALAWAYDLFDKLPFITIIISVLVMFFASSVLLGSIISGMVTTFGATTAAAILWAIINDKVRRLQRDKDEIIATLKESLQLVKDQAAEIERIRTHG